MSSSVLPFLCLIIELLVITISNCDEYYPVIISKNQWNAVQPKCIYYQIIPIENVVILSTETSGCSNFKECQELLQSIQSDHMNDYGLCDIAYSFLISEDGLIYEGVGWHKMGSHTYGYNSKAMGIAFIGSHDNERPSSIALLALEQLLGYGDDVGKLSPNYKIFGQRQLVPDSRNPGIELYNHIKEMERWSPKKFLKI